MNMIKIFSSVFISLEYNIKSSLKILGINLINSDGFRAVLLKLSKGEIGGGNVPEWAKESGGIYYKFVTVVSPGERVSFAQRNSFYRVWCNQRYSKDERVNREVGTDSCSGHSNWRSGSGWFQSTQIRRIIVITWTLGISRAALQPLLHKYRKLY